MVCSIGMDIVVISHILLEAGFAEKVITRLQSYLFSKARINIWYLSIANGAEFLLFRLFFVNFNLIMCRCFNRLVISIIIMCLCDIKVSSMYFFGISHRCFLSYVLQCLLWLFSFFTFIIINFKMSERKF